MIAVLADIHSNLESFQAVLADMERKGVTQYVCLGDVIGYGPSPRETLRLARSAMLCLQGDHERALQGIDDSELSERSLRILNWTFNQIFSKEFSTEDNKDLWLQLEKMARLQEYRSDDGVLFVHGSPTNPTHGSVHPSDVQDSEILEREFTKVQNICFCGHTHLPGVFVEGEGYLPPTTSGGHIGYTGTKMIVNVGSVGYPKDIDHRACYVTYDGSEVVFHRVQYDGRAVRNRILRHQILAEYWIQSNHLMRCLSCGVRLKAQDYHFSALAPCPHCDSGVAPEETAAEAAISRSPTVIIEGQGARARGSITGEASPEDSNALAALTGIVPSHSTTVHEVDSLVGQVLQGYQILNLIGRGGMAKVYKAKQLNLDRLVAVKMLPPELTGEERYVKRFEREALSLARVNHPNVVIIHDFFQAMGRWFLAMEFVDGVPLSTLIQSEGRLEYRRALGLGRQALLGLGAAHAQAIIHRDVSPTNIMVLDSDTVKLMDFGIAVAMDRGNEDHGVVIGTANYMAPEQLLGREVDWRSDLYGLGASLYQSLTGVRPFEGLNMIQRRAGQGTLAPLRQLAAEVPKSVAGFIERLLAPDKKDRPSSIEEAVQTIDTLIAAPSDTPSRPLAGTGAAAPARGDARTGRVKQISGPRRTVTPATTSEGRPRERRAGTRVACPHCGRKIRAGSKTCLFCRRDIR